MGSGAVDDAAFLRANPAVVLREESDEVALLFDPDTGEGYSVNGVAVFIWKLLDGKTSVQDIVALVAQQHENVDAEVDQQVRQFLQDLLAKGLAGHEV